MHGVLSGGGGTLRRRMARCRSLSVTACSELPSPATTPAKRAAGASSAWEKRGRLRARNPSWFMYPTCAPHHPHPLTARGATHLSKAPSDIATSWLHLCVRVCVCVRVVV